MSHVRCYRFTSGIIPPELRAALESHPRTKSSALTGPFVHDSDETPHSFLREKKSPADCPLTILRSHNISEEEEKDSACIRGNNDEQLTPIFEI